MSTVADILNDIRANMCFIRGGVFQMGDRHGMYEPFFGDGINCVPVKLNDFYISAKMTTCAEWAAVMENKVRDDANANKPVTGVSWTEVQLFIEKLNSLLQWEFRLPTEAEWEYAARGGELDVDHVFAGDNILMQYGWYDKNSNIELHDVATKKPNLLGLYDMSGNAWEWCQDWYAPVYPKIRTGFLGLFDGGPNENPKGPVNGRKKVIRGGAYISSEKKCWVFYRNCKYPNTYNSYIGFRLAY